MSQRCHEERMRWYGNEPQRSRPAPRPKPRCAACGCCHCGGCDHDHDCYREPRCECVGSPDPSKR